MIDLSGKWVGTVVYGAEYKQFSGKELFFEFELIQQGDEIAGTAIDTGGTGVSPDQANILGTFKNNKIIFLKQYESSHYYSGNETKIDRSKPGPKIKYTGEYNEQTQTFSGEWVIKITFLLLWIIPMRLKSTGSWTMQRK